MINGDGDLENGLEDDGADLNPDEFDWNPPEAALLLSFCWDLSLSVFTESPSKQSRRDAGGADGDKVKDIEMDKQESDEEMETTEDQEIKTVKDSKQIKELKVPQTTKGKNC